MDVALLVLVVTVVVVAGVGALVFAGSATERRRAGSLAAWAEREGWRYDRERPELVDRFSGDPFVEGRSDARATHVLCAELRGHRVLAFEYRYTASHHDGRDTRTTLHTHTVVVLPARSGTPVLELREESLGHVVLSPLGVHDLRLGESAFDSRFYVATSDDRFAHAVLDEQVRGWLAGAGAGAVPFRFDGEHLLCWNNRELDADRVRETAQTMVCLLERVPAAAWESAPGAPGAQSVPDGCG
ncbi:hypothetical protein ACFWTE_17930 [Nocardiopsis sp. NPDC058631]|uniref:hypothetical protein n=1 Tax=Nocardiopsis sp. NPDC058631 TaxID=3346566 RepID=UPI00365849B5